MADDVLNSVFEHVNEGEGATLVDIKTSPPTSAPVSVRSGDTIVTTTTLVVMYTHRVEKVAQDESPGAAADVRSVREAPHGRSADERRATD